MYYYRFRDYSPLIGRFLQPDPLGYIDGLNLYAYVNNNPLIWIDPWGLCKEGNMAGGIAMGALGTALLGGGEAAGAVGALGTGLAIGAAAWGGWEAGQALDEAFGLSDKIGLTVGTVIGEGIAWFAEHKKGKRKSTEDQHDKGRRRHGRDRRGGEKGDKRRPY